MILKVTDVLKLLTRTDPDYGVRRDLWVQFSAAWCERINIIPFNTSWACSEVVYFDTNQKPMATQLNLLTRVLFILFAVQVIFDALYL